MPLRNDLAIIITARIASERLYNKVTADVRAIADIDGEPLLTWIIRRLRPLGRVILATTEQPEDDQLYNIARETNTPIYRGSVDDVIERIDNALLTYAPDAKYVLRGLGDCPFMATELIARAVEVMEQYDVDAFCWHLAPYCWPVYGSREFPYSRVAWQRIVRYSQTREHSDMYFHEHRDQFKIIYHEPPKSIYFRNYRLEVDWPEDLELIRQIARGPGMLAPVPEIIRYLDAHHDLTRINAMRTERTGPTCYTYEEQRQWTATMRGQPVVSWQDTTWSPPTSKSQPVFCTGGKCMLGFAEAGVLHTKDAMIRGEAKLKCECGSILPWRAAKN